MKKETVMVLIIMAVIIVVVSIFYHKNLNGFNEDDAKCIAEKSALFVLPTCSHCAYQISLLGNYSHYFTIIDCIAESEKCIEQGISSVPTWIIDGKKYSAIKTTKELKKLAGC